MSKVFKYHFARNDCRKIYQHTYTYILYIIQLESFTTPLNSIQSTKYSMRHGWSNKISRAGIERKKNLSLPSTHIYKWMYNDLKKYAKNNAKLHTISHYIWILKIIFNPSATQFSTIFTYPSEVYSERSVSLFLLCNTYWHDCCIGDK